MQTNYDAAAAAAATTAAAAAAAATSADAVRYVRIYVLTFWQFS